MYKYDIALSFAGEDRDYVSNVAKLLIGKGIRVFYDEFENENLWGKDLYEYFDEIYRNKAKYCIVFLSKFYHKKAWTTHERKSAQARAFSNNEEYILPARFDNTEVPGIRETIGYIDLKELTPEQFSEIILRKIHKSAADEISVEKDESPGIRETMGFVDLRELTPEQLPELVLKKTIVTLDRKKSVDDAKSVGKDKDYGTKFVEEELPIIMNELKRKGLDFSIVFIDIDDLTKINKHFGHEVGDTVLDIVYKRIRRRSVARYNGRCGDDTYFAVLFDISNVADYCEKVRKDIGSYPWKNVAPNLHVTCTMGYAVMKPDEAPYGCITRSIFGMLEGKNQGGDKVQEGPLFLGKKEISLNNDKEPYVKKLSKFKLSDYFS